MLLHHFLLFLLFLLIIFAFVLGVHLLVNRGCIVIKQKLVKYVGFASHVKIPGSVEIIGEGAFENCNKLETVHFAEKSALRYIDMFAFSECTSLKEINLPDSMWGIAPFAFSQCTGLEKVTLSSGFLCDTVQAGTFIDCVSLTDVTFPDNIRNISYRAFGRCESLTYVSVPKSAIIAHNAFTDKVQVERFDEKMSEENKLEEQKRE